MIRKEEVKDINRVFELNTKAFKTSVEAMLVDELREKAKPLVSLVYERDGHIIGHIMLSPISIESLGDKNLMGLAPMAVLPEQQKTGIGTLLVNAALDQCREMGVGAIVVLGDTGYYSKFGFKPSVEFGFKSEYNVADEVFMALELESGYLKNASGLAKYHEAFKNV